MPHPHSFRAMTTPRDVTRDALGGLRLCPGSRVDLGDDRTPLDRAVRPRRHAHRHRLLAAGPRHRGNCGFRSDAARLLPHRPARLAAHGPRGWRPRGTLRGRLSVRDLRRRRSRARRRCCTRRRCSWRCSARPLLGERLTTPRLLLALVVMAGAALAVLGRQSRGVTIATTLRAGVAGGALAAVCATPARRSSPGMRCRATVRCACCSSRFWEGSSCWGSCCRSPVARPRRRRPPARGSTPPSWPRARSSRRTCCSSTRRSGSMPLPRPLRRRSSPSWALSSPSLCSRSGSPRSAGSDCSWWSAAWRAAPSRKPGPRDRMTCRSSST